VPADVHHFEDFELDPSAYRLSRNGDVIRLERMPLKLLCLLVERRGEIVTRGEILEHIWGKGVFIDSESAINTAVRKIRRALGDDPDAPRSIVTLPAKGYRFIAQVEVSNDELKDILNIEPTSDGGAPHISDAAEPALPSSANTPGEPIRSNFWLTVLPPQSRLVPIAGVVIAVASIALPHLWQKAPHTPALVSSSKSLSTIFSKAAPRKLAPPFADWS
jgi:DNA-binding winged helix-turn-helix (wHTH) protein